MADKKDDSKGLANFINSLDPHSYDQTLLNDDWLNSQPKARLIDVIKVLAARQKAESTAKVKRTDIPVVTKEEPAIANKPKLVTTELVVPAAQRVLSEQPEAQWELFLIPKEEGHRPLQIKILDNFTVGRTKGGKATDLDLTPFGAAEKGVSGQHAAIQVAADGLYLVDLSSTNGTYYQNERVELGNPAKLTEGAVIAFGKLVFLVSKIKKMG
ncbi:MAG: FHA domain-containing protein [Chloroflexi bacterium]|nr:MAG: FHA domain-containing protein [Chloroflexota bacterium]MBL1195234.1 FHA domain-containing protein [Chloroflexota bacterium]NOH12519.1 FHA domain-containing protein [Chloroflexota bacterium]